MDSHFRSCLRDPCSCDLKRYWLILLITVAILALEIFGSIASGSLALLSDAGHVFGDTLAIGVAIIAERIAIRSPQRKRGARVIGAGINALIIILTCAFIGYEAYLRFRNPNYEIVTGPMIVIAALGAAGNYVQAKVLGHEHGEHVGRQAVRLHVLSDLWQSLAVVFAGLLIWITGWRVLDPVASVLIVVAMLVWTTRLLLSIAKSHR